MVFSINSDDRFLARRTHDLRENARRTAYDLGEFSDEDILIGQLERGYQEGQPVPTGEHVNETYRTEPVVQTESSEGEVDVRTLPDR